MGSPSFSPADLHLHNAQSAVERGDHAAAASAFGAAAHIGFEALIKTYCLQASAYYSAELYDDARKAADSALHIAPREAEAFYWRGAALLKLGKREEAKAAFERAVSFEKVLTKKVAYKDWAAKCEDEGRPNVLAATNAVEGNGHGAEPAGVEELMKDTAAGVENASTRNIEAVGSTEKSSEETKLKAPVDNTRMQWYQSASHVSIDIYAKNVVKEQSSVSFENSHISVRLVRPNMAEYVLDKSLFEDVVATECTWSASKFKVEIRLKKLNAGSTWRALDKDAEVVSAAVQAGAESKRRKEEQKYRDQQLKSITEDELKDVKEDDSSMGVFRTLYKDADDDVRRAMMKSYSESGGQVLSTNWDEVKKKKVVYEEKKD